MFFIKKESKPFFIKKESKPFDIIAWWENSAGLLKEKLFFLLLAKLYFKLNNYIDEI